MSECTKQSFGEASSRSIQRYRFYGNWDGEAVEEEDHNGDYVKYDDHIAEVERIRAIQKAQAEAMWKTNAENEKLQARIDELEEEFRCLDANYVSPKQIKAEGIREMWAKVGVSSGHCSCNEFVLDYADKLEKGDE